LKKQNITERRFKCPTCNFVATAYKKSSRRTSKDHLKKMWCPFCKTEHNFVQLSKWD
jgi:transposase-like protein